MVHGAFISTPLFAPRNKPVWLCTARPPNDPSSLRTESQRRRNSPPKPLRRRRRRREEESLDWDAMESIPLVRPDASPESGEDYWVDVDMVRLQEPGLGKGGKVKRKGKKIDEGLKDKLKEEVVSPWKDNWILRVGIVVVILVLLVWVFGGEESVPIIKVPDL